MHKKVRRLMIKEAVVNSFGVMLSKMLGVLYVIPFYMLVKDYGGYLYGSMYVIYSLFLAITMGIFLSFGKAISEFEWKSYNKTKNRAFRLAKLVAITISIISFLLLFFLAPLIAKIIVSNPNVENDLSFVIRTVSIIMLIVPINISYKSYLKGINENSIVTKADVFSKLIQLLIVIFGSLFAVKVFHFDMRKTISISLFGYFIASLFSYIYLISYVKKNNLDKAKTVVNEKKLGNKELLKHILRFSLVFMMVDVFKTLYDVVDVFTITRVISNMNTYSLFDAQSIVGITTLWGPSIYMIIIGISTGIIVSFVSNLKKNSTSGDINHVLQVLLLLVIPLSIGFSLLSKPIWYLFYGNSKFGPAMFSYLVYVGLLLSIYMVIVKIMEVYKDYKVILISLVTGFSIKLLLNIALMKSFNKMGLPPYIGSISTTLLGIFVSIIICLAVLHIKYKINYESTLKELLNIFIATILMAGVMILLRFVLPLYSSIRLVNLLLIIIYSVVGLLAYFFVLFKTKSIGNIMLNTK